VILTGHWCFMPVILATQEADIRRMVVWSQPGEIVRKTLKKKTPSQTRAGAVAQVISPGSSPSTTKKAKQKNLLSSWFLPPE
jgi:hypothetical protein